MDPGRSLNLAPWVAFIFMKLLGAAAIIYQRSLQSETDYLTDIAQIGHHIRNRPHLGICDATPRYKSELG